MKKYFKMLDRIQKDNLDITKLYLLSCFDLHNIQTATKKMNFTYNLWIETDIDLDLSRLADIVEENWEIIENDEMQEEEIIDKCVNY